MFAARVNNSEQQRAALLLVVCEVGLQLPSVFTPIFAALLCRTLRNKVGLNYTAATARVSQSSFSRWDEGRIVALTSPDHRGALR